MDGGVQKNDRWIRLFIQHHVGKTKSIFFIFFQWPGLFKISLGRLREIIWIQQNSPFEIKFIIAGFKPDAVRKSSEWLDFQNFVESAFIFVFIVVNLIFLSLKSEILPHLNLSYWILFYLIESYFISSYCMILYILLIVH